MGLAGCPQQRGDDSAETSVDPGLGRGCGLEPACDRGVFVGSVRVISEDEIDLIAGHTGVTGWLEVFESDLECLDFLRCVEDVGHDVTVFGNPELTDVRGLDSLATIGSIEGGNLVLSENAALETITGFSSLETIPGSLNLTRHDALDRVEGFESLRDVGQNLTIRENPGLESLQGLHQLESLGGRFVVTQNPSLCLTDIAEVGMDLASGIPDGSTAANAEGC